MKELSIYSPANVAVNYKLASLSERSLSFVIDFFISFAGGYLLAYFLYRLFSAVVGDDQWLLLFFFGFLPLIVFLGYFATSEYLNSGQTIGKRIVGLRTIRIDGAPPTFETYGLRALMLFIDFYLSAGTIGLISSASNQNSQRLGDRIAQTIVIVNKPSSRYQLADILSIKTIADYDVQYNNANQLSLEQALFIKELIVRYEKGNSPALQQLVLNTVRKVAATLGLAQAPTQRLNFLRQVLRDYIVLTR